MRGSQVWFWSHGHLHEFIRMTVLTSMENPNEHMGLYPLVMTNGLLILLILYIIYIYI